MPKKISDKLQEALWRAQCYLEEPGAVVEDWTPEQVEQYYKAKDSLDALIQAAQDEVWELIEKVLLHYGEIYCCDKNFVVCAPHLMGNKVLKKAILEAAKELETE